MFDAAGAFERGIDDGLAGYERDILAHWDAGASIDAICAATGRNRNTVRLVVTLYDDRPECRADLVAANDRHVAAVNGLLARMSKPRLISVDEIVDMLTDRIEALVADLLPNAYQEGSEMCVGSLAGERGQSLRIHVGSGSRRGWWRDFLAPGGTREGGNPLWLIACVLFGGDDKKAVRWAKGWLNLDDSDPAQIEQFRLEARASREGREEAAAVEVARKRDSARRRWHQASALAVGDPVYRYYQGRGIDFAQLGRFPGALRYHPRVQYGFPAEGLPPLILPAALAMVTNLAGEHIATHRTWLDVARNTKAGPDLLGFNARGEPNDPKKVMGSYIGGHIPLWKGRYDCPLRDIPAGTDVWAAEGCEDGVTAACGDASLRVIAMIALGNLATLELPDQMGRLIILKQNDAPGSPAEKVLMRGVQAQRARGKRVLFCEVPRGVKDINELAQTSLREGV